MSFAERIKELRQAKSWSVYDLANAIRVKSRGYVSKIEARGEIPSPEMIIRLADALDADAKELFELAKTDKSHQLTQSIHKKYDEGYALFRKGKKE
jgi:transcriptional regulator with XRE-family HTH domain